jgi:hypothetical protein
MTAFEPGDDRVVRLLLIYKLKIRFAPQRHH